MPVELPSLFSECQSHRNDIQRGTLFSLRDYLELVDHTGRVIQPSKRGYIPDRTPPILDRLGLSQDEWLQEACEFEARYTQNRRVEQGRQRQAA